LRIEKKFLPKVNGAEKKLSNFIFLKMAAVTAMHTIFVPGYALPHNNPHPLA
jgi:hypothetical protein